MACPAISPILEEKKPEIGEPRKARDRRTWTNLKGQRVGCRWPFSICVRYSILVEIS